MFVKFSKSVAVLDAAGEEKYRHEAGTVVDWEPSEAESFIEQGAAAPLDDTAKAHYEAHQKAEGKAPAKVHRIVAVADIGKAADAAK